jgi:sugar lactone lactonase YvrE
VSDRFDYLEIGDQSPATLPPPGPLPDAQPAFARTATAIRAVEVIGEPGKEAGQFNAPTGLCVDPWGSLYIADSNNHRVQRITPGGDVYVYGRQGTGSGQMWGPQAVAVYPSGKFLFVAEQGTHRVHCFRFDNGVPSGFVTGFRGPSGVAFDAEGKLWIADTGNARLMRLDLALGEQGFVGEINSSTGVQRPVAVAGDRFGNVYVVDGVLEDVIRYSMQGQRLSAVSEYRQLSSPRAVAVDRQGRLYVAEAGVNRLHVLDAHGASIMTFEGEHGHLPLKAPGGVALGPNDEIYLADTLNHRVLRLEWT